MSRFSSRTCSLVKCSKCMTMDRRELPGEYRVEGADHRKLAAALLGEVAERKYVDMHQAFPSLSMAANRFSPMASGPSFRR